MYVGLTWQREWKLGKAGRGKPVSKFNNVVPISEKFRHVGDPAVILSFQVHCTSMKSVVGNYN